MLLASLLSVAVAATPIPDRAPDETLEGDLAAGQVIDNSWAQQSTVACFPGTMSRYFSGAQTFFVLKQDPSEDVVIRVRSKDGADLSLYALQLVPTQSGSRPPNVASAWRCTPGYAKSGPADEAIRLGSTKSGTEVVLAVVGADGATSGGFTVEIWEEPGRF